MIPRERRVVILINDCELWHIAVLASIFLPVQYDLQQELQPIGNLSIVAIGERYGDTNIF
jgi:hypothetical protein